MSLFISLFKKSSLWSKWLLKKLLKRLFKGLTLLRGIKAFKGFIETVYKGISLKRCHFLSLCFALNLIKGL